METRNGKKYIKEYCDTLKKQIALVEKLFIAADQAVAKTAEEAGLDPSSFAVITSDALPMHIDLRQAMNDLMLHKSVALAGYEYQNFSPYGAITAISYAIAKDNSYKIEIRIFAKKSGKV